jgi:hypothetical protein
MKNDLLECEDFFALLKNLYEERLPFNKMLGIQVVNIGFDNLCVEANYQAKNSNKDGHPADTVLLSISTPL